MKNADDVNGEHEVCRRVSIAMLKDWVAQVTADAAHAIEAMEKAPSYSKPLARLVSRATWPLGFASTALANVYDYVEAHGAELALPPDEELVAQSDASVLLLRKAFSEGRLRGEWMKTTNHPANDPV